MTTRKLPCASAEVHNWRELYRAALFETDMQKLPSRIVVAERALTARARQLFARSDQGNDEWRAVDKGLYALRSLRECLKLKTA